MRQGAFDERKRRRKSPCRIEGSKVPPEQLPVAKAKGPHLFSSRTQKLSPSAPMVLGWKRPGRVGRRRLPTRIAKLTLCNSVFLRSSMAEHPAVNRVVAGSSPAGGAMSSRTALSLRRLFSFHSNVASHTLRRSSFPAKTCGLLRGKNGVAEYDELIQTKAIHIYSAWALSALLSPFYLAIQAYVLI